jgi:RNA polymerase sigma-70 factor (ECF subfamily)
MNDTDPDIALVTRAAEGDKEAVGTLFARHRERLQRMVRLRMNPRLQGRLDASDIVQDAFVEITRRLDDYLQAPKLPFFVWLRHMTGLKLTELHRRHLGTEKRDARRELSLQLGPLPIADSASLAAQLMGKLTSPSQVAMKAEMRLRLQEALGKLDPVDQEIVALRHFEQLTNRETAEVLGMPTSTVSDRHFRAIRRLKQVLQDADE